MEASRTLLDSITQARSHPTIHRGLHNQLKDLETHCEILSKTLKGLTYTASEVVVKNESNPSSNVESLSFSKMQRDILTSTSILGRDADMHGYRVRLIQTQAVLESFGNECHQIIGKMASRIRVIQQDTVKAGKLTQEIPRLEALLRDILEFYDPRRPWVISGELSEIKDSLEARVQVWHTESEEIQACIPYAKNVKQWAAQMAKALENARNR